MTRGERPLQHALNAFLVRHGSIQANTLPSRHAAGAVAIALALWSLDATTWPAFAVLAAVIPIATVAGRYPYTVDAVAGIAVACVAWALLF